MKLDNKAVSPVIGVILMVAITVLLASVIALFVLNMGTIPQHKIVDLKYKNQFIYHNGGDSLNTSDIKILVNQQVINIPYEVFEVGDKIYIPSNSTDSIIIVYTPGNQIIFRRDST